MGPVDIIILLLAGLIVFLTIFGSLRRRRRNREMGIRGGCCGGCAGCPHAAGCSDRKEDDQEAQPPD